VLVDTGDLEAVRRAADGAAMIYVETPSNPLLGLSDIEALAGVARDCGAVLACDNTFATPVLQEPIALGADLVVHSATKYLGGHSDVLAGVVVGGPRADLHASVRGYAVAAGATLAPFSAWLLLRSLPTLPLRVRAQSASAAELARRLARHPRVAAVHYPGLPDHPGHALALRQMQGFGGMLAFHHGDGPEAARALPAKMRVFTHATSLGGVESLIEHRASSEGPDSTAPQDLLRVSVGLENVEDLWDDLARALGD
jgi:cystathionine gamma-synthase